MKRTILVTGGAGFIGSNFISDWIEGANGRVINLDLLTYAGNQHNLDTLSNHSSYTFIHGSIGDCALVSALLAQHKPCAVINFAAESHVDRSILDPEAFINTNIVGTYRLLTTAHQYWIGLSAEAKAEFRFLHVSTDEVYGSLGASDPAFTEQSQYQPNSPYSASKASADHLVRTWHHTYGLPTLITNCSNNYGPFQFPEKLIPLVLKRALAGKTLPVYGDGLNIRDWIFVKDHCEAVRIVLEKGAIGENYNIGGNAEKTNLDVVSFVCLLLDQRQPAQAKGLKHPTTGVVLSSYVELIEFVQDRPGHDRRYAIDSTKMLRDFGWQPRESFVSGLSKTVEWYINNPDWVKSVSDRTTCSD